ncbi:MAG: BatA domain-containing protein [Cyclobacteriaceae bacterium]
MLFTNPIALWALAGLSLPIAIHMLSRKEGKVIRIGSLRHLHETNTQQFKGIRLNEIVLLVLRCLMIILFVLLMGGLSFYGCTTGETKWVIVEKRLEHNPEVERQLENFREQGYELHWLSDDFPMLQDSIPATRSIPYRSLAEQLKTLNLSEAIVLAKNKINGFSGIRTPLTANIRWIGVTPEPEEFTLNVFKHADSTYIRKGFSNASETYFTTQAVPSASLSEAANPQDTLSIAVYYDQEHAYDKKIIEAILRSIKTSFATPMKVEFKMDSKFLQSDLVTWIIWLSSKRIPPTENILYTREVTGYPLIVQDQKHKWRITKSLNEEIVLQENLSVTLASIIVPSTQYQAVVRENDQRMIQDSVAWSQQAVDKNKNAVRPLQSADSYLISILLTILLIERLLAYHKNQ